MVMGGIIKLIPKIIHYCWFGGGEKPTKIKKCINTWKIAFNRLQISRME